MLKNDMVSYGDLTATNEPRGVTLETPNGNRWPWE